MMRSLWTAATGMTNQQLNIDTIANNLSNVNTTGYKKERLEFKTLLYETMKRATLDPAIQQGRPVNMQVGHGVRAIATTRLFNNGNLERTDNELDFALEGEGFFVVEYDDDVVFTRDGSFKISVTDAGKFITTSDGYYVLSTDGERIQIPDGVAMTDVNVDDRGNFTYADPQGLVISMNTAFALVQFQNRQGLETIGGNFYKQTVTSGAPIPEEGGGVTRPTRVLQSFLEMSNVQIAEEMVKLIVAQRAYEINSKIITTSDEMLQTANTLRR